LNLFLSNLLTDPWYYFSWVFIVMFSICLHEYAHAVTALNRGDDTAATQGHLTLNPLIQMGWTSLILLCVVGIAWGSVPVNPGRYRSRADSAMVAAAGPAANVLLSVMAALLAVVFVDLPKISAFFQFAGLANAVLFLLNMLPVPMLDGWSVFSMFIPRMQEVGAQQAQSISLVALVVIFATPAGDLLWEGGRYMLEGFLSVWAGVFAQFL
jgi:Zn-dependent protease